MTANNRIIVPQTVPASTGCTLHLYHWPRPSYLELHHPIPQAWQKFWSPESGKVATTRPTIWDDRTEPLCRTGHGNVHIHLVNLMRTKVWGDYESPKTAREAYPGRGKEYEMAYLALVRWKEAGGSLAELREARLWGGMWG